jgi:hypothetical protein
MSPHIPAIDQQRAESLWLEVYRLMNMAQTKERVRLRELLGLDAEPCQVYENVGDCYMYCSTHGEMWHKRRPRPAARCFADQEWDAEPVGAA